MTARGAPTGRRARRVLGAACVLVLASVAVSADDAELARRSDAAQAALAAGDPDGARHHVGRALELAPGHAAAMATALELDAQDDERRALWVLHAALAAADGSATADRSWRRDDALATVSELGGAHDKPLRAVRAALARVRRGDVASRVWLSALGRELAAGMPAASAALEDDIRKAAGRTAADPEATVAALLSLATAARSAGDLDVALEAARTIRGLHLQANQDEATPAVESGAAERAARLIALIRRDLREREVRPRAEGDDGGDGDDDADADAGDADGDDDDAANGADAGADADALRIWSAEELWEIPDEETEAWNERHAKWSHPGVGETPEQRYRVETVAGLATLRAVVEEAEAQHDRLARWFETDPFEERQGVIRISPDYRDFEGEGQRFWWAAGFQSGDLTNLIARFATREGLGRTLTHELTHRFDQALFPGMPAWLVEGRATFTETGSLALDSDLVREEISAWGRVWETSSKGYGSPRGLRKLLRGEVDDYRHNYDAGYSLFLFLRRFCGFDDEQTAPALFRPRIDAYLRSFRTSPRTDPVARFEAAFCDGDDGRPETFDGFVALWGRFIGEGGSGARPFPPWKETWAVRARKAHQEERGERPGRADRIFDRPTFRPSRTRHDRPDHGQYHARVAARLLADAGRTKDALVALRWTLDVDEPDAADFARAAELSREVGDARAWAEAAVAHQLDARRFPAPEGPPPTALRKPQDTSAALVAAYEKAQTAALAAGSVRLGRALRAEHDRLAFRATLPELGALPAEAAAKLPAGPAPAPESSVWSSLLREPPEETRWAPLDSRPGRWHVSGADALELGRAEAGPERTGALRDDGLRRTFVEAASWWQGAHGVRARVRFVSAYAQAELVVGKTHRDRGVRVVVVGGDRSYARGESEANTPLREVAVRLVDLGAWGRSTSEQSTVVRFPSPRDVFTLDIQVVGPLVRVLVDGEVRITHRRPREMPVEGRVGFGLHSGVVRFEEPAARRLRTVGPDGAIPGERLDAPLDPARRASFPWPTIIGRRFAGLAPHDAATLVLWFPEGTRSEQITPAALRGYEVWFRAVRETVRVVVALPPETPDDDPWLTSSNETGLGDPLVIRHAGHVGLAEYLKTANDLPDGSVVFRGYPRVPVWLVLDDRGVVRSASPFGNPRTAADLARALAGR